MRASPDVALFAVTLAVAALTLPGATAGQVSIDARSVSLPTITSVELAHAGIAQEWPERLRFYNTNWPYASPGARRASRWRSGPRA